MARRRSNYSVSSVPRIHTRRSQFDLSHPVKTSGNVGTIYPFDVQEVYSGDSFRVRTNVISRLTSTFLRPVIDNLFLDIFHFYVPSRQLYDKYVNIFGENTESAWAQTGEFEVPTLPDGAAFRRVPPKSVANYLGLPVGALSGNIPINILPFRAFAKIYDEWFRDQNNVSPMHVQKGERVDSEVLNNNPWAPNNYFGQCPKASRLHDYFTTCLPAPQKGDPVSLGLAGTAPVTIGAQPIALTARDINGLDIRLLSGRARGAPLFFDHSGSEVTQIGTISAGQVLSSGDPTPVTGISGQLGGPLRGSADLSQVSAVDINDLRFAVQYQKLLERDARSGSRYFEYLKAAFGVDVPNMETQRSEFLGGRRIPISITQVTQTTGDNSETSPLGALAAYSHSGGRTKYNKGFLEHGYVISCFVIRQFHTYQQGVEKFWTRRKRLDFYDPVFQSIGEQPVYKSELYAFGEDSGADRAVFGYQEAWADLRQRPARVSGQLVSGITDSLDVWHFGDNYANAPTLNADFIEETPDFVDRAISVESSAQDQFLLDFWLDVRAYRAMPVYSVPSLLDHH